MFMKEGVDEQVGCVERSTAGGSMLMQVVVDVLSVVTDRS